MDVTRAVLRELDVFFTLTTEQKKRTLKAKGCFALLLTGFSRSLAKHCRAWRRATGRCCAVNVVIRVRCAVAIWLNWQKKKFNVKITFQSHVLNLPFL